MTGTLIVNLTRVEIESILIAHVTEKVTELVDLVLTAPDSPIGVCEFDYISEKKLNSAKITIKITDNE